MLVGGTDVSSSEADGQQNHAALVVGKEAVINRIYENVVIRPIPMSYTVVRKFVMIAAHTPSKGIITDFVISV